MTKRTSGLLMPIPKAMVAKMSCRRPAQCTHGLFSHKWCIGDHSCYTGCTVQLHPQKFVVASIGWQCHCPANSNHPKCSAYRAPVLDFDGFQEVQAFQLPGHQGKEEQTRTWGQGSKMHLKSITVQMMSATTTKLQEVYFTIETTFHIGTIIHKHGQHLTNTNTWLHKSTSSCPKCKQEANTMDATPSSNTTCVYRQLSVKNSVTDKSKFKTLLLMEFYTWNIEDKSTQLSCSLFTYCHQQPLQLLMQIHANT